jgi:hypothetical protein
VEFESTIPAIEQEKTVHAANVIGMVPFSKYNKNNQVKKNKMGRTCRTHGGEGESMRFWWESHEERDK